MSFRKTRKTGKAPADKRPAKDAKGPAKAAKKPQKPRRKPEARDTDDGADMNDPNRVFTDAEDRQIKGFGQSNWSNLTINNAVHALLSKSKDRPLLELAKEFCIWAKKSICAPNRPNAYERWGATIKRSFASFDERKAASASSHITKWCKTQAKDLASQKLYEPSQAERFLMRDIMELWFHWMRSDKLVRREAVLYSAITFFTGARAIEVSKLHIEDLYFAQSGAALVCPVRESKTNVFKNIPERLTMVFVPECPIDFKALFLEIKGHRTSGKLFQACKNRRTLCYHYGVGAMELGWSRTPSGHSGRTTAITMGIAVGVPRTDLEIMFRWKSGSEMYRRYRSVHMECSQAGAPAMVARALVGSLYSGPLGTPAPVDRLALKDDNVDLGWYKQTITKIQATVKIESGLSGAKVPKTEPSEEDPNLPHTSSAVVPYRTPAQTVALATSRIDDAQPMHQHALGSPIHRVRLSPTLAIEGSPSTSSSRAIEEVIPSATICPVQQASLPTPSPKRAVQIPKARPKPAKRTTKQSRPVTVPSLLLKQLENMLG